MTLKVVNTKGRQRNPEATCSTCPFFETNDNSCRIRSVPEAPSYNAFPRRGLGDWCAEHTDFWLVPKVPAATQEVGTYMVSSTTVTREEP